MLIGYMRVSKNDGSQVFDLQKDALTKAGVEDQYIYSDMASGLFDERQGLKDCLKALRDGDVLVVYALDRLGRNSKHLIQLIEDFNKRNIGFKVLNGAGAAIDTTTMHGKLVYSIFAAMAEFEAGLIKERTKAGLVAARARGRLGGRPRKMTLEKLRIAQGALRDRLTVVIDLASTLGVTPELIYMYMNSDGSLKEKGQQLVEFYKNGKK